MKYSLLTLGLTAALFINCNKEEKLTGDYCVCKVNGKRFVAGSKTMFSNSLRAEVDAQRNSLIIECSNDDVRKVVIGLNDTTTTNHTSGTFNLSGIPVSTYGHYGNYAFFQDYNKSYTYEYSTDALNTGYLKMEIINGRVSGTFAFKARYNGGTGEEVNVTEGKFSLPYR